MLQVLNILLWSVCCTELDGKEELNAEQVTGHFDALCPACPHGGAVQGHREVLPG